MSKWFIWKKGYRTITKNKRKVIPIVLLMLFSIGFGSLMFDMQDARHRIIEETIELTNFTDGFIYTDPINASFVNPIMNNFTKDYIEFHETRAILGMKFEIKGIEYDGLIIGINLSRSIHINALVDENKHYIRNYEYCLDYSFAKEKNIKIGQEITLKFGSKEKIISVEDIGFNTEFLYYPLVESIAFPSFKPFPVLYVDIIYLNDNFIPLSEIIINEILYKLKSGITQEQFEKVINDNLGLYVHEVLSQDESPFLKTMREDEEGDRQFLLTFVFIFIAGSLIVLISVIHRLIEFDLKSISVFQGLGAKKREILSSYLIFNLILFTLSLILGGIVGVLSGIPISQYIATIMGIPFFPQVSFTYLNIFIIGLAMLVFSLLTTIIVVMKSFKMDIQQSLKHETKFLDKTPFLEKIILKLKNYIHPFTSYNLRKIIGKKLYLFFIFSALIISSCFLVFAYSLPDSIDYSIDYKINKIEKWDGVATTWDYTETNLINDNFTALSSIDNFELGISELVLFNKDNSSEFNNYLHLMAYENGSKMHSFELQNGKRISNIGECYITKDIISKYSVNVGGYLYVKNHSYTEAYRLKITGIINDFAINSIYLYIETAQEILGYFNKVNTIFFTIASNNTDALIQTEDLDYVQKVVLKDDIEKTLKETSELFNVFTIAFGIIFTLFGLLIFGTIVKNLVEYRIEDYANMKALGLFDFEIKRSILKEVFVYFVISIPIGIILGNFITSILIDSYGDEMMGIHSHIYPISYLYLGINLLAILFVVLFIQFRKVKNMNITEITKMKTFG